MWASAGRLLLPNDLHLALIVCEALAAGGDDTIHAIRAEVPACVRTRADMVTTPAEVLGLIDAEVA